MGLSFTKQQRKTLAYAATFGKRPYREIASHVGVDESTLFRWRQKSPEFAEALERARAGQLDGTSEPVDIETFIRDRRYLGLGVEGLDPDGRVWPEVLKELGEVCSGRYDLILLVGGVGAAKTYVATVSLVYQLYRLLLLDNPHKHYGLDPASPIILAVQNRTRKLAERNDYALARNLITASPWFQQNAPWDERLKSRVKFLKHNVELWPASGDAEDLLGLNLFSLILDESNFFARVEKSKRAVDGRSFDGAREAFEAALRRKQSRFPDGSGMFFVASSRRYRGQFTDVLEREFEDDSRTYTYCHSEWTIRPGLYKDKPWLQVFKGDRLRPPRILERNERVDAGDRDLIISVPQRFERRFRADPVRSLQDLAGISTEISGGFFTDRERLGKAACLENTIIAVSDVEADATLLLRPDRYLHNLPHPESPRVVHGDLSLTGDLTGIACGHIRRYDERGLPEIDIDAIARVHPPRNGQIELDSVLRVIQGWIRQGIPVTWCTFDGYQSADLLQRVKRLGVKTGRLSVDQTKPKDPMAAYECLRAAISEGRFRFPDDAETVEDMLWLQADYEKRRVDHLPGRKKDVSDCLAAIAYHLSHNVRAWTLTDKVEGANIAAVQPQLGGVVTPIPYAGFDSYMDLVRWREGIGYADGPCSE